MRPVSLVDIADLKSPRAVRHEMFIALGGIFLFSAL